MIGIRDGRSWSSYQLAARLRRDHAALGEVMSVIRQTMSLPYSSMTSLACS